MKRFTILGFLLGLALLSLPPKQKAATTKIAPSQIDLASGEKIAAFSADVYDLRPSTVENAINEFRLKAPIIQPTLATMWVYADGKLLAEGYDYSVVEGLVTTVQAYYGVVVQIRYLSF